MRKICYLLLLLSIVCVPVYAQQEQEWIEWPEKNNIPLQKAWTLTFSDVVTKQKIKQVTLQHNNSFDDIQLIFHESSKLTIRALERLQPETTYILKIYLTNGKKYRLVFTTKADPMKKLQAIPQLDEPQYIKVEANEEEGFYFPYYIRIPSTAYQYKTNNANEPRYVVMDTPNSSPVSAQDTEQWVINTLTHKTQWSVKLAEKMWTPMIMPVTPRSHVCFYTDDEELNCIDEHSLDRDTATLAKLLRTNAGATIRKRYAEKKLNANAYLHYDEQLIAMFKHATAYLQQNGYNVQSDRMIVSGFSAGGTFSDRLAMLQPAYIKAVISGATLDDMMLPLDIYKEQPLIYPIGVADYEEITGRPFSVQDANKIAKLIFMGDEDIASTLPYTDAYGERERQIIISAFGEPTIERAKTLIELYGQAGGKGIFVFDPGVAHDVSKTMEQYMLTFALANRKSMTPVYPQPIALPYVIAH